MAEPSTPTLAASEHAFAQDLHGWVARTASRPGCRRLVGQHVVTVRHLPASPAARAAVEAAGLRWPAATGDLHADARPGPAVTVRIHPGEVLVIASSPPPVEALLQALPPGAAPDAVAVDLSHAMVVIGLEGPGLDRWLARLVDAGSMPSPTRRATRCRLGDVAVVLMRWDDQTLWIIADRSHAPYLAEALAFARDGAFPTDET